MLSQRIWDHVYGDSAKLLKIKNSRRRKLMLFGVCFGGYLGYKIGFTMANKENNEKFLTEFDSEDQLFHILKTENKPILINYFTPGGIWYYIFRKGFMKGAKEFHEKAHFVQINCAKSYDVCRAKKLQVIPTVEMWKCDQNSALGYKIQKFHKDFSYEGIEAFLEENDVIERKIDPTKNSFAHHQSLFNLKPVDSSN